MIGIYKITSPSGKVYIGSSSNIQKRFKQYKRESQSKKHPKLYNSFKKYGIENHIFEVIEECTVNVLLERELFYALKFNVLNKIGLNCSIPKAGDAFSYKSDEVKAKISKSMKGKKHTEKSKTLMSEKVKERFKNGYSTKGRKSPRKKKFKVVLQSEQQIIKLDSVLDACKYLSCVNSTIYTHKNKVYKGFLIKLIKT